MKIFFGVQGTGNGHITRARALAPKLKQAGIEVDYLFTGRARDEFFEMDVFGDWQWRKGLTFQTGHGNVRYLHTAFKNNLVTFVRDVLALDLSGYDRVITDFEPVTSWAARAQGVRTLGIGHQYAFGQDIPVANADVMGTWLLKNFAPASVGLGVHWHHFDAAIVPPIIETDAPLKPIQLNKIIVYLPFEETQDIIRLLKPFNHYQFHVYSPHGAMETGSDTGHIQIKATSRKEFRDDFADCSGVICNAGFELPSECLHLGKRLLVKPLHGQMEQGSNALALSVLQLGHVMHTLDKDVVGIWLDSGRAHKLQFPDVAQAIVDWLQKGDLTVDQEWVDAIWRCCRSDS